MFEKLIKNLKKYNIKDIIKMEEKDRQFLAIKQLYKNIKNSNYFLPLIITNALLWYQLSSKWENYWEEFCYEVLNFNFKKDFSVFEIEEFFKNFLPKSKWNKRLLNIKISRIKKILLFLDEFIGKEEIYYENILQFQEVLAKFMKQKNDAKTIVFSIKMFHYWARLKFKKFIPIPFEIAIPIDSRIKKLTKKYNNLWLSTKDFWFFVSKKVNIPILHLDTFLWTNCDEILKF